MALYNKKSIRTMAISNLNVDSVGYKRYLKNTYKNALTEVK